MITMDSILNAFKTPIVVASWLVLISNTAQADPPPPETFNKPTELVLTLSDDMRSQDNSDLQSQLFEIPNQNKTTRFARNKGKKGPINMNCGMNANPYADTDKSIVNRLSGACDLTYNY